MIFNVTFNDVFGRNYTKQVEAPTRDDAVTILANKHSAADIERIEVKLPTGLTVRIIEPRVMWQQEKRLVGQIDVVKDAGNFSIAAVYEDGFDEAVTIAMNAALAGDIFADYSPIRKHLVA